MTRKELASANFCEGKNCAQAVLTAFSDISGLDEGTAMRLSSSLGGGMGRLREVCGAVSAIFLVAGMLYSPETVQTPEEKTAHHERIQTLAARFRAEHGSILCRELLESLAVDSNPASEARTAEYYKKRPCAKLCGSAAAILEQYIAENPPEKRG